MDLDGVYIFALASCVPSNIATMKGGTFGPFSTVTDVVPTPELVGKHPDTFYVLSIGGSAAGQSSWANMMNDSVDAWVTYFEELFQTTGIHGIDWDLENISGFDTHDFLNFIGDLSTRLRADGHFITVTTFGNPAHPDVVPTWWFTTYPDGCDYIALMLYNGGNYAQPGNQYGWCTYAEQFRAAYPAQIPKLIYALWPTGSTRDCCQSCIDEAKALIHDGKGAGIALWCYGGYLGVCSIPGAVSVPKIIAGKTFGDCTPIPNVDGCGTLKTALSGWETTTH
jgi:hypothetical protein